MASTNNSAQFCSRPPAVSVITTQPLSKEKPSLKKSNGTGNCGLGPVNVAPEPICCDGSCGSCSCCPGHHHCHCGHCGDCGNCANCGDCGHACHALIHCLGLCAFSLSACSC